MASPVAEQGLDLRLQLGGVVGEAGVPAIGVLGDDPQRSTLALPAIRIGMRRTAAG